MSNIDLDQLNGVGKVVFGCLVIIFVILMFGLILPTVLWFIWNYFVVVFFGLQKVAWLSWLAIVIVTRILMSIIKKITN